MYDPNNTRRNARRLLVVLVAVSALIFALSYVLSFKKLVISYDHVQQVSVYRVKTTGISTSDTPVRSNIVSGQTIKLRPGNYMVRFQADDGYADRDIAVSLTQSHHSVRYSPFYSDERLASQLNSILPSIKQAIQAQLPISAQYNISPGALYQYGDWYGTELVYKGTDIFNNDTVRVVLHLVNGKWMVATNPPNITLSSLLYKDVPVDVLRAVNKQ